MFVSLKTSITSSPLLVRFDSTTPLFLKTDWSSTGMGYILMQPDDSADAQVATTKLSDKNECDFDLSLDGTCLRPILFNSRSCTSTERDYPKFHVDDGLYVWRNGIYRVHIYSGYTI